MADYPHERYALAGHHSEVFAVKFSPDGALIASGSRDRTIRVWRTADGAECAVLEGHRGAVHDVAFHPDGTRLASVSSDTTVRLWDTATWREVANLEGHGGIVRAVAFSSLVRDWYPQAHSGRSARSKSGRSRLEPKPRRCALSRANWCLTSRCRPMDRGWWRASRRDWCGCGISEPGKRSARCARMAKRCEGWPSPRMGRGWRRPRRMRRLRCGPSRRASAC